jgi:hypothetical protein
MAQLRNPHTQTASPIPDAIKVLTDEAQRRNGIEIARPEQQANSGQRDSGVDTPSTQRSKASSAPRPSLVADAAVARLYEAHRSLSIPRRILHTYVITFTLEGFHAAREAVRRIEEENSARSLEESGEEDRKENRMKNLRKKLRKV